MSFSCAICHEFVTKDPEGRHREVKVVAVSCGHVFHEVCIEQWFTTTNGRECVTCKKKVSGDLRRLYPNGTEEGEDIDKLNVQNKQLVNKLENLENLKKKAERDLAKAKEDNDWEQSILATAQMELESMVQSANDLRQKLEEQTVISESVKTEAERQKKRLEDNLMTSELKNTEQHAKIVELTQELREAKTVKVKLEAELTALTNMQRVRETIDLGSRKPLLGRRAGSEDILGTEDRPTVSNGASVARTRLLRSATTTTTPTTADFGTSASPKVEDSPNGDVFSSPTVPRARQVSMGCQTEPLGTDFALEILDGTVDYLGMCIRILQDEKKLRDAAAENGRPNGVQKTRSKKGPQQASTRPLGAEEVED